MAMYEMWGGKQTYGLMEPSREPRGKPTHLSQLIYAKKARLFNVEKTSLFDKGSWENQTATCKRTKLHHSLTSHRDTKLRVQVPFSLVPTNVWGTGCRISGGLRAEMGQVCFHLSSSHSKPRLHLADCLSIQGGWFLSFFFFFLVLNFLFCRGIVRLPLLVSW